MNEHTTHPRSARRHPRALFGQMQIYAQNNPRGYAVRASLVIAAAMLLPMVTVFLAVGGDPALLVFPLVGMLVPLLVLCGFLILFMPRVMRRMLGTSTLPPDTDPVDLLEAKRQMRRGGLHEDEPVNRAARIVAAQAEAKVNSPKAINAMSLVGALLFAGLAVLNYSIGETGLNFWWQVGMALLFASYLVFLGPWAKRYRQRARDFAELYDARERGARGPDAPEPRI
ncbi:hypothetical protein [Nocardiopsis nanhaiensis]